MHVDSFKKNSTVNDTDEYEEDEENGGVPAIVVHQMIYLSILAVIGVITNLIVLVKSIQYERSFKTTATIAKNSTNFLVISLAIGDLGTSTFSVAVFILPSYVDDFPITDFFCKYIQPLRELFTAVSIFSVTLIAVGRYLILLKAVRKKSKIFSSWIINNVILWVLSYLIFALPFSAINTVDYADGAPVCDPKWKSPMAQRVHITIVLVIHVFLPTLMVFFSYIGIIQRLRRARMVVTPEEVEETGKPLNTETMALSVQSYRIVKVSLLLLIAFFITYLPYAVMIIAIEYGYLLSFPDIELLFAIANCLLYSCAVINPLILIFSGELYRPKCGLKLFGC